MPMNGEPSPDEVSLYIHVPFCRKKCEYCHFFVLPHRSSWVETYEVALDREWHKRCCLVEGKKLVSIYFGGGTPSLWQADALGRFLEKVLTAFPQKPVEITLEVNPETVEKKAMQAYHAVGINRISMGVQALDDFLLAQLTRTHSASQAEEAVHLLCDTGFASISIDLMYDIPGQTEKHWETTLARAAKLPIQHLSLYNLTFEPGSVFYKKRSCLEKQLPSSEISAQFFRRAREVFGMGPWMQYEISAFCLPGHHSRHNTGYWLGRPFLGLGPSAFSFWEGKRFRNVAHLGRYSQALDQGEPVCDFEEQLFCVQALRERLVIRLRLLEGVDLLEFQKLWGKLDEETEESIARLVQKNWLMWRGSRLCLTEEGILFYDSIAIELI